MGFTRKEEETMKQVKETRRASPLDSWGGRTFWLLILLVVAVVSIDLYPGLELSQAVQDLVTTLFITFAGKGAIEHVSKTSQVRSIIGSLLGTLSGPDKPVEEEEGPEPGKEKGGPGLL